MLGTMPRPKKIDRPRRSRTYRLPEDLIDGLDGLAESNRRPSTSEVEIAIEEHLRAHDRWPPKPIEKSKAD